MKSAIFKMSIALDGRSQFIKTNLRFEFRNRAGDRKFKLIFSARPNTRFLYDLLETGTRRAAQQLFETLGQGSGFDLFDRINKHFRGDRPCSLAR
ncbi:MAG: hypothetical protein JGK08_14460 [Microcoleus sp. PH2017_04_SCI_O_A]|nr:hypothetical protein [Microcoleus sp. PH2017_04_SCI_O_A]